MLKARIISTKKNPYDLLAIGIFLRPTKLPIKILIIPPKHPIEAIRTLLNEDKV